MSKKHVLALTITLVLGIIVGVSATGVVFANTIPAGIVSMMGGNSHMGIGYIADHHLSEDMPEACDQDIFMSEDCPDVETHHNFEVHHQNMHR